MGGWSMTQFRVRAYATGAALREDFAPSVAASTHSFAKCNDDELLESSKARPARHRTVKLDTGSVIDKTLELKRELSFEAAEALPATVTSRVLAELDLSDMSSE